MNKNIIRNKIKQIRNDYKSIELNAASECICNRFYAKYSYLDTFLLYYPVNNEVNTLPLINKLYNEGKSIYLPIVSGKNINFHLFTGVESMVLGKFGIYEPMPKLLDKKADIICVPAIAYDVNCSRIGYGGGYYDRFLSCNKNIIRVGFAYKFQIVDYIDSEAFDENVDEVFTEDFVIRRET